MHIQEYMQKQHMFFQFKCNKKKVFITGKLNNVIGGKKKDIASNKNSEGKKYNSIFK